MKNVTAIITGDIHLRDDVPICRTDDYIMAMWKKIEFIRQLQEKYKCFILDAGDLFDTWRPSHLLVVQALQRLPEKMYTVPGNHEIPQHNIDLLEKSALAVLDAAHKVNVLSDAGVAQTIIRKEVFRMRLFPYPYGSNYKDLIHEVRPDIAVKCDVAIIHEMFYRDHINPLIPGESAESMIGDMPFDLIVTGHNHQSFFFSDKDKKGRVRWWVNPGSMMRSDADQVKHIPQVFLWDAVEHEIEAVPLPIEKNVITREHIERKENKDARLEAFVQRVNDNYDVGLSYSRNLESFFKANSVRKPVQDIIWESLR